MEIKLKQIGIIHSPFREKSEAPIQPLKSSATGRVEVFKEYSAGLKDIEGFSHSMLLYCFHKSAGYKLSVKPFLDSREMGLFATRAPWRPNPIGLSVVKLAGRKGNILEVKGIDCLDGTPLLDIKPYVPPFDSTENVSLGWLEGKIGK